MKLEQILPDALRDLDAELSAGKSVAVAIDEIAVAYGLLPHILSAHAEKQFGPLTKRRRWLALANRSRRDLADFLTEHPLNTDWQTRVHIELKYEEFLSKRYKKKVSAQRMALAANAIEAAFMHDFEMRSARRKARGIRNRNW